MTTSVRPFPQAVNSCVRRLPSATVTPAGAAAPPRRGAWEGGEAARGAARWAGARGATELARRVRFGRRRRRAAATLGDGAPVACRTPHPCLRAPAPRMIDLDVGVNVGASLLLLLAGGFALRGVGNSLGEDAADELTRRSMRDRLVSPAPAPPPPPRQSGPSPIVTSTITPGAALLTLVEGDVSTTRGSPPFRARPLGRRRAFRRLPQRPRGGGARVRISAAYSATRWPPWPNAPRRAVVANARQRGCHRAGRPYLRRRDARARLPAVSWAVGAPGARLRRGECAVDRRVRRRPLRSSAGGAAVHGLHAVRLLHLANLPGPGGPRRRDAAHAGGGRRDPENDCCDGEANAIGSGVGGGEPARRRRCRARAAPRRRRGWAAGTTRRGEALREFSSGVQVVAPSQQDEFFAKPNGDGALGASGPAVRSTRCRRRNSFASMRRGSKRSWRRGASTAGTCGAPRPPRERSSAPRRTSC